MRSGFYIFFLSVFIPLIPVTVFGQGSWQKQSTGLDNHLFDIDFVNTEQGWLTGSEGLIAVSVDGGESWTEQHSRVTVNLNALCFVDETTGYIAGDSGTVLKTVNGGINWEVLPPATDAVLADILFADELTGWVVAQTYPASILKTADGGQTWKTDTINTTFPLYDITRINENKLVASGGFYDRLGYVVISEDAGETWQDIVPVTGEPLFTTHFTSSDTGYAMGGDFDFIGLSAWKTVDGGQLWTEIAAPLLLRAFTDMAFISTDTAWVCAEGGLLYRFTVANEQWELFASETWYSLFAIDFVDENHGWVCGAFGFLSRYERNIVSVNDNAVPVNTFNVSQNYPNPFNPVTVISYQLPAVSNVEIIIYNALGQKVELLLNQRQPAGTYSVDWHAGNYPGGIYYYRFQTNGLVITKKMLLVK